MELKDNTRDWVIPEHNGSFRAYMNAKQEKLRVQFERRKVGGEGGIFKGVTIHVNGYTKPSHTELKELMIQWGGGFENYFSNTRVTHIICSNLTDAKLKQYQKERNPVPVVHPDWIMESIRAKRLLDFSGFVLQRIRLEPNQKVLQLPRRPRGAVGDRQGGKPSCSAQVEGRPSPGKRERDLLNNVDSFFKNSRLHFIGSWKANIDAVMSAAAALNPPRPKRVQSTERQIIHVDIDCFFASVAVSVDPSLEGKPVAVCHSDSSKGTAEISSCSYEARKFGVKAGMYFSAAKELCPGLVHAPYYFEKYQGASAVLYRILLQYSACVQPVSIDEAYADISGLGDSLSICDRIRSQFHKETGLRVSTGASHNMLLAKIATNQAKPDGTFFIRVETSKEFMKELPVKEIPGVGYKSSKKLAEMGMLHCSDVWLRSKQILQQAFGSKTGELIWEYSHGRDSRAVKSEAKRQTVGAEINWGIRFTSNQDAIKTLEKLSEEVQRRLEQSHTKGRSITLKLKLRKPNAPPPSKFLGHGWCDNISRSITLACSVDDNAVIAKEAVGLLFKLGVDPREIRGIGIQITKLDEVQMGARKRTIQPDVQESLKQASRKREPRLKEIAPDENVRLSDIDINEQKYILSMIKAREREQSKRKLFFAQASGGHSGRQRKHTRQAGGSGNEPRPDPGPDLPPPVSEAERKLHRSIDSARYVFEVCEIISAAAAEEKALVRYVSERAEGDLEKLGRLLKAIRLVRRNPGAYQVKMVGSELEAAEVLIQKSVEQNYGGVM
ncbi:DNA polymerase IV [Chloropicon primus]|uniref:DNA polymerase kappa n=1 Tax=Chloropicon primus TaxID=1764295 RepID=A0A5B8MVB8_9CHLO|nr:DNA polymerase IV [Chloropicon primus]UPR02654.1 DNA polymerase IV [Chloropicon primus]|eukprot:QDZ23442.1 DNA polymerase IV [Chloropicon primus]